MESSILACSHFLKSKSIKAQKDWLEACIEWLTEENNGVLSIKDLKEQVYEQWLLSDLREIAEVSFPPSLSSIKGTKTIGGIFAVQVNSIIDIGHSAYSQLQKIKGQELDYNEEGEEEDNTKEFFKRGTKTANTRDTTKWKEVSSRMLFMELHDGCQSVKGLEYQPIKHLNIENIMPGAKVLLTGLLTIRDGMFLLKAENIKLLGGNSEQLLTSHSQSKILKDILHIEDNVEEENVTQAPVQNNLQQQQPSAMSDSSNRNQQYQIQTQISTNQNQINKSMQRQQHSTSYATSKQASTSHKKSNTNTTASFTSTASCTLTKPKNVLNLSENFFDDSFGHMEMDDWDFSPGLKGKTKNSQRKDSESIYVSHDDIPVSNLLKRSKKLSKKQTKFIPPLKNEASDQNKQNECIFGSLKEKNNMLDLEIDDDLFADDIELLDNVDKGFNQKRTSLIAQQTSRDFSKQNKRLCKENTNNNRNSSSKLKNNNPAVLCTEKNSINNKLSSLDDGCLIPEPNLDDFFTDDDENMHFFENVPNVAPQVVPAVSLDYNACVKGIKMSEMVGTTEPIRELFSVKGWFKTLSSELKFDGMFKLLAIMTNGTCYAEVLLGDEALSNLIGYSAKQVQQAASNQISKREKVLIKQALKNAEHALEVNKWLMHFLYDEQENIYKVVKMQSLES
ncbi:recQ-mediated genome instability protein 1-like [Hydractinia symbiolongicarpus]|uniref:recQ-mediated genome instability protein 1-like n=1 Tax=Hydractinia symbiolongicarpus TaxID=13093 RepID=UPI0025502409|nr:recQ-mediated genome instability protein 1-like [Hydractinia symbiolongicarpus]